MGLGWLPLRLNIVAGPGASATARWEKSIKPALLCCQCSYNYTPLEQLCDSSSLCLLDGRSNVIVEAVQPPPPTHTNHVSSSGSPAGWKSTGSTQSGIHPVSENYNKHVLSDQKGYWGSYNPDFFCLFEGPKLYQIAKFSTNNLHLCPVTELRRNEASPSFAASACWTFQKVCAKIYSSGWSSPLWCHKALWYLASLAGS